MESFSLLKYWKIRGGGGSDCCNGGVGGGGGGGGGDATPLPGCGNVTTTTTIVTAVGDHAGDSDSDGGGGDDEGPFFDLEFAVPADDDDDDDEESLKFDKEKENVDDDQEEESDVVEGGEREVKFRLSSTSSCDNSSPNLSLSPSDNLFFKGRIVRMDGSDEEITSKSDQFPIPVSLLRSATRFRVFMLNLKRSKSESTTTTTTAKPQNPPQKNINKKLFTVKMKFKVEDVPILSLVTRASSNSKLCTATAASTATAAEKEPAPSLDSIDEKRQKKEVIQKYLKLVKPLYIRVSKRKPPAAAEEEEEEEVKEKGQKQGMKLKEIAKKHLGKSKTAVVHSMPNVASERRDDSLLQQQDGIQSAILHCKRSFNASTEGEEQQVHDACQEEKKTTTAVAELREEEGNDGV